MADERKENKKAKKKQEFTKEEPTKKQPAKKTTTTKKKKTTTQKKKPTNQKRKSTTDKKKEEKKPSFVPEEKTVKDEEEKKERESTDSTKEIDDIIEEAIQEKKNWETKKILEKPLSSLEEKTVTEQEEFEDFGEEKPRKKKIRLGIFLFLVIILLVAFYFLRPCVELRGGKNVKLAYNQTYKEKGYTPKFLGRTKKTSVKVSGKVNEKKLGVYRLTYTYRFGFLNIKAVRNVHVVDEEAPKITLNGEKEAFICKKGTYKEEGFTAIDNYDKDVTKKVKTSKDKNGNILYQVKDSSGNIAKVTRKVTEKDILPPEISLNGDETIYLIVGATYEEAGATANDNCSGDVSKEIKIEGEVNTGEVGTYKITYTVEDQEGNKAVKERTIHVQPPRRGAYYGGIAGHVYLTFDDGPSWNTTPVILDVLKEEGVKATFFVIHHEGTDDLLRRIVEEGHTLALHTYSHDYSIYQSVDTYFNDLNQIRDHVKNVTGVDSHIIRFPGGSSNTISRRYCNGIMSTLTNEVISRGYKYYDWNISSGDAGETKDPNEVYQNVVNRLSHDRVNMILMHDIKPYTRDAIRNIVRYGKENGYTFARIDDSTEMVTQRVAN